MYNNPSPGNKRGGLTTILEKSLGTFAKGGTAPMVELYEDAQPITTPSFTYMDSPGCNPASVTGQIASCANLIAFSTGRGSVSGFKPAPGLKLATNTEMCAHMAEDMDINCGVSIADKGRKIFEELVAVASGKQTESEELGFGGAEFVPWQIDAVM
jgi:altronate dehydratase